VSSKSREKEGNYLQLTPYEDKNRAENGSPATTKGILRMTKIIGFRKERGRRESEKGIMGPALEGKKPSSRSTIFEGEPESPLVNQRRLKRGEMKLSLKDSKWLRKKK